MSLVLAAANMYVRGCANPPNGVTTVGTPMASGRPTIEKRVALYTFPHDGGDNTIVDAVYAAIDEAVRRLTMLNRARIPVSTYTRNAEPNSLTLLREIGAVPPHADASTGALECARHCGISTEWAVTASEQLEAHGLAVRLRVLQDAWHVANTPRVMRGAGVAHRTR